MSRRYVFFPFAIPVGAKKRKEKTKQRPYSLKETFKFMRFIRDTNVNMNFDDNINIVVAYG